MEVETNKQEVASDEQMCCDDSGRTAEEHRAESPDGKCCSDG
jgi:hypothetical protein